MQEHRADDGSHGVENTVGREPKRVSAPNALMEHHAERNKCDADADRIKHHCLDIEFQRLLRTCADARHPDTNQFNEFAGRYRVEHLETSNQLQDEPCNTIVCHDGQIHDLLHNHEKINATPERVVHLLLFPCLFYSHDFTV